MTARCGSGCHRPPRRTPAHRPQRCGECGGDRPARQPGRDRLRQRRRHAADLGCHRPRGWEPTPGHSGGVSAVAVGRLRERDVIVSGGYDRKVQIWDVTGHPWKALGSLASPATGPRSEGCASSWQPERGRAPRNQLRLFSQGGLKGAPQSKRGLSTAGNIRTSPVRGAPLMIATRESYSE
jgi:hypothetical protein